MFQQVEWKNSKAVIIHVGLSMLQYMEAIKLDGIIRDHIIVVLPGKFTQACEEKPLGKRFFTPVSLAWPAPRCQPTDLLLIWHAHWIQRPAVCPGVLNSNTEADQCGQTEI